MLRKLPVAVVVIVAALLAVAAARAQDKSSASLPSHIDTSQGASGHLRAKLLLVDNEAAFNRDWATGRLQQIKSVHRVARNKRLTALIVFSGCTPNRKGKCNARVDYKVLRPDGSVYAQVLGNELWSNRKPPAPGRVQVGVSVARIRIENKDPLGQYTVRARVWDLNSDNKLVLQTHFTAYAEPQGKSAPAKPAPGQPAKDH
ncbi:MAG: hypothetical protein P8076_01805 [Gammaproteobacteria bacterium]|jgi:hypothetical protein